MMQLRARDHTTWWGLLFMIMAVALVLPAASHGCERWDDGEQIGALLRLVEAAHPVLLSERDVLQSSRRQYSWRADVLLSYAIEPTNTEAQGANTLLRVSIPLFDHKRALATAKQQNAVTKTTQQIREAFLADLQTLCTQAANVQALDTQRAFYRDRLQYQQKRVDEGLDEAVSLWSQAEKMQQAEFDWRREDGELTAQLMTLSRKYGGHEWKRLQALLGAMLN